MRKDLKSILADALKQSIDYPTYKEHLAEFVANKSHSGGTVDEALANYTKLTQSRMRRWEKTLKPPLSLVSLIEDLQNPFTLLFITESWCGDAAPSLPAFQKITERSEQLILRIVYRDQHPSLMDEFLTNGARSIPKVLLLDEHSKVLTTWGPRSKKATAMVEAYKKTFGTLDPRLKEDLQKFYNEDKGKDIFEDIESLFRLEVVGNGTNLRAF